MANNAFDMTSALMAYVKRASRLGDYSTPNGVER
jgi:hypothetical protein